MKAEADGSMWSTVKGYLPERGSPWSVHKLLIKIHFVRKERDARKYNGTQASMRTFSICPEENRAGGDNKGDKREVLHEVWAYDH